MAEGKTRDKEQIKQELTFNRKLIDTRSHELHEELTFSSLVKYSIKRYPLLVIGGIFVSGTVLAKILLSRPGKNEYRNTMELPEGYPIVKQKSSLISTIGKMGLGLAIPVVKPYLTDLLKQKLLSTLSINKHE